MGRRLESTFDSAQGEDWFSIPVFFVLMRETLEVMVVIACMYNALEKLNLGGEKRYLAYGCLAGLAVDVVIGVVLISVFYSLRKNAFDAKSNAEIVFEGTLMLFTCIVVTVFALGLSKFINGLDGKISRKLSTFTEAVKSTVAGPGTSAAADSGDLESVDKGNDSAKSDEAAGGAEDTYSAEWRDVISTDIIVLDASVDAAEAKSNKVPRPAPPSTGRSVFRAHRRRPSPAGHDVSSGVGGARFTGEGPGSTSSAITVPGESLVDVVVPAAAEPGPMAPKELSKLRWGLWSMAFMAIVREGLECIVFLAGLTASYSTNSMIFPAIAGVLVGLALGYLFIRTSRAWAMVYFVLISVFMLFAIGGGLISRAFTEFKELGMNAGPHLYNARSCCNQNTPFWGFLRIIFGYNDKPSVVEFLAYVVYWAVAIYLAKRRGILEAAKEACKSYHVSESEKARQVGIPREKDSREPLIRRDARGEKPRGSGLAMSTIALALVVAAALPRAQGASSSSKVCVPTCSTVGGIKMCSFTATVNIFASTMGYFRFEECGETNSPTLGIYPGVVTTFYQHHSSNWYHPLGFGYLPDGIHKTKCLNCDERELDPAVTKTGSDCATVNKCMAPMYFLNDSATGVDTYLGGNYSNMPEVQKPNKGHTGDFGLDGFGKYEESFGQTSLVHWIAMGRWSVKFKWTDAAYTKDLFYFCHVHDNMSGRIKLLKADGSGGVVQSADDPPLGYSYDSVGEWDASCGTNHLEHYAADQDSMCAVTNYLCQQGVSAEDTDNEDKSRRLSIDTERRLEANSKSRKFDECLAAMDCAMHHDMKRYSHPTNPAATFVYQMIPHHINAINMAKSLLAMDFLKCDEANRRRLATAAGGESTDKWRYQRKRALANNGAAEDEYASSDMDCEMIEMLQSIVNDQNAQITFMRKYLTGSELAPEAERCPNVQPAITDTPVPFFILLGVLSALVAMTLSACRAYQWGMVEGREYEYGRLAGNDKGVAMSEM